jgi:DNA-binding CsgD family transcriptional regulator
MRYTYYVCFLLCFSSMFARPTGNPILEKGWEALVKDHEDIAFRYFWTAYEQAKKENNTGDKAESLLCLGICSFGSSLEKGLQFATQSLHEFKKLEKSNPGQAKIGRSKCLQLISTIYSRQKKYDDAIRLSREVIDELKDQKDDSGTLGLAYSSIGAIYEIKKRDSTEIFFRLALAEFIRSKNFAYLPNAYIKMGQLAQKKNHKEESCNYFSKALAIADSTQNQQARVSALIAIGKWRLEMNNNTVESETNFLKARQIAKLLSDKMFEIKTIEALIFLKNKQHNYAETSQLQNELLLLKDNFYSLEREQIIKSLEIRFDVSEKDRKLRLISKEKEVSRLTNILLVIGIFVLLLIFLAGYFFMKKINRRDKQLLRTKEELVALLETQKKIKEDQFQNDLEHKENQLNAITFQMLQKNELLEEIKAAIENETAISEKQLLKIVNKHFTQDQSWNDFDRFFESINKNFYTRLKQKYPDISSNDLKICALIKLNLSIKEMASILNISPDSVKTARYRLRKKLQLASEENLTDFILSI